MEQFTIQQRIEKVREVVAKLSEAGVNKDLSYSPKEMQGLTIDAFREMADAFPEMDIDTVGTSYWGYVPFDGIRIRVTSEWDVRNRRDPQASIREELNAQRSAA